MLTMLFLLFSLGTSNFSSAGNYTTLDYSLMEILAERHDIFEKLAINTEDRAHGAYLYWDSIPIQSPMKFSDIVRVSSDYGYRVHPILHMRLKHNGIDLSGETGSDIFSTASGVVEKVKMSSFGYGNQVIINHSNGYKTRYAHLGNIVVSENETVQVGDKLGTLGNTGLSTGPHLHYEVIKDGNTIDPLFFSYKNEEDRSFESYKNLLTALERNKHAWYVSQYGDTQAISTKKVKKT